MTLTLMIMLSLAIVVVLLWLLFGSRAPKSDPHAAALEIKKFLPVHCRNFPQVQQILKAEDKQFMLRRAPVHIAKPWNKRRRKILRMYAQGLEKDFRGLQQMARLLAALSPEVKRAQEWEWLLLGMRFRGLYRLTMLRLALRGLPPNELARLTELVTGLALELERIVDRMTETLPQAQPTAAA